MAEDLEEYQTTLFTSPTSSTASLPPPPPLAQKPQCGSVHGNPDLYKTVMESMTQAVPLGIKPSGVGTKTSGLFYVGDTALGRGEMLFLTNPLVMARSPDEDQAGPAPSHSGPMRDADMCDYCFKGPRTFSGLGSGGGGGSRGARHAAAQRCTGCDLLSFCNKACHHKAWKQFHRLECGLLKTVRRRDPVFLMYLRMLLLDKAGRVAENVIGVLRNIGEPLSVPAKLPPAKDVKNCALQAYHLLSLEHRDFFFVRDVLCRILGSQAVLATADEAAIVHCFDVSLALLNHSCEPNAFVFVEGRQVRVRSVRAIQPGDEITVSLVDTRLDVYNRHAILKTVTWNDSFVCKCNACESDHSRIAMMMHGDREQEEALRAYHEEVVPKANALMLQFKSAVWETKKTDVAYGLVELADGAFIARFGKELPVHVADCKPIPWLRMAGAAMFLELQDLENAVFYAALACLLHERHFGPEAVAELRIFANILRAICKLPETSKAARSLFGGRSDGGASVFPSRQELGALAVASLVAYKLLVVGVYGPKLGFSRAVLRWQADLEALCAPLRPCSARFEDAVQTAQRKLMTWCIGDGAARFYPVDAPTKEQYAEVKAAAAAAAATAATATTATADATAAMEAQLRHTLGLGAAREKRAAAGPNGRQQRTMEDGRGSKGADSVATCSV